MNKEWYIACINDPRSIKYLPIALKSVSKTAKVWIPTHLVMKKKRSSALKQDAWVEVERPLYPGYVFIQCDKAELYNIEIAIKVSCKGWLLKKGDETSPKALTESEIKKLKLVSNEHQNKKPQLSQFNLNIGQEIEMIAGPFKGFKAVIKGIKKHMLQVNTTILGRSTIVEVSIEQCVPVN